MLVLVLMDMVFRRGGGKEAQHKIDGKNIGNLLSEGTCLFVKCLFFF